MKANEPIHIVYVLFENANEARRIARQMVERQLAACVNIMAPCQSIYRWEGEVEDGTEVPAIFKTSEQTLPDLMEAIADAHSYLVPSISSWPLTKVHNPFAEWVRQETPKPTP